MRPLLLLLLCLAWPPTAAAQAPSGPGLAPPAPTLSRAAAPTGARAFWTRPRVATAKASVASLAAGLLAWGAALRRASRSGARRRLRDGLLLALAGTAALAWTHFLNFHYPGFAHPSEFYHYYLGSKYFRELGYTRLYACTAVADLEAGVLAADAARPLRDLETNAIGSTAAVLAEPERCTRHFRPERWREFTADVAWMRQRIAPARWSRIQLDHGYNATPVWGILGTLLAERGPVSDARIRALAALDPLLLAATAGAVAWAFGWRALCVALIYWATAYTSDFGWNGGGFLRQDWLAASVIGICLVRRARPAAGGFLLATAALLRIFPALILSGLALGVLRPLLRGRRPRLSPELRRIAAGGLLAAAVLLPAAALTSGGFGSWAAFARNSHVHLATPLLNHVGLRTLLSYDHATRSRVSRDPRLADPVAPWKQGRRAAFERRRIAFALLLAGYAGLLAWAVRGAEAWVALVLGIGAIPMAAELTGYYHAILLGFGLLWCRREGVGVALLALAALGWALVEIFRWPDEILTWLSLATVAFVVHATAAVGAAAPVTSRAASGVDRAPGRPST